MFNFKVFQELAFYSHATFKAHLLGLLEQHIFNAPRQKKPRRRRSAAAQVCEQVQRAGTGARSSAFLSGSNLKRRQILR